MSSIIFFQIIPNIYNVKYIIDIIVHIIIYINRIFYLKTIKNCYLFYRHNACFVFEGRDHKYRNHFAQRSILLMFDHNRRAL